MTARSKSPARSRSETSSTRAAVSPTPAAIGTSTASERTRPGTTAKKITNVIGRANSDPRLWLISAMSTSTTAPPASRPRTQIDSSRRPASRTAGQKAISHVAAAAFG